MAVFDQTFRQDIQDELKYRKDFNSAQTVYIPHVRLTSLITGELNKQSLYGFTLGMPDLKQLNTIDSFFNVPDQGPGTIIGMTYKEGSELATDVRPVVINTGIKNCPPPGVTEVSIDTSASRGLTFKAVVKFKFYGKEQYDFLFQTFMRPGNQIVIEYGHTRNPVTNETSNGTLTTGTTNRDLGFFKTLDGPAIARFTANLKRQTTLPASRNAGVVLGFVSNFKVRLTDKNEYEAEIELINSLEFLFALSPKDTFLNYGRIGADASGKHLSRSIVANFGYQGPEGWTAADDVYFRFIMRDVERSGLLTSTFDERNEDALVGRGDVWQSPTADSLVGGHGNASAAAAAAHRDASLDRSVLANPGHDFEMEWSEIEKAILLPDQESVGFVYVSLYYFFRRFLQEIITRGYVDKNGVLQTIGFKQIILHEFETPFRRDLRSTDISRVIINNENLYTQLHNNLTRAHHSGPQVVSGPDGFHSITSENAVYFSLTRRLEYRKKYVGDDLEDMFLIAPSWGSKELYKEGETLKGIFINYLIIKDAFTHSRSVAEAIQKVLNTVNNSTNGILNLKMRNVVAEVRQHDMNWHIASRNFKLGREDTPHRGGEGMYGQLEDHIEDWEAFKISVYDEAASVSKEERPDLYTFFNGSAEQGPLSEAMSYNLDFSMPNSIAAGVVGSTFSPQSHYSSGGNTKDKAFIDYGYTLKEDGSGELAIRDIIEFRDSNDPPESEPLPPEKVPVGATQRTWGSWTHPATTTGPILAAARAGGFVKKWWDRVWTAGEYQWESWQAGRGIKSPIQAWQKDNYVEFSTAKRIEAEMINDGLQRAQFIENKMITPLGYQEFMPMAMKADAHRDGFLTVFPASAKISIKIQGLDGFRFGDLFSVMNILPDPYNTNNIFMLHGYKHRISSDGWFTELDGQFISIRPDWVIEAIEEGTALLPDEGSGPKDGPEPLDIPHHSDPFPDKLAHAAAANEAVTPEEVAASGPNNNPFNLRWDNRSKWQGAITAVEGESLSVDPNSKYEPLLSAPPGKFIKFVGPKDGFRAGFWNHITHNNRNIANRNKHNNIYEILYEATPPSDNPDFWLNWETNKVSGPWGIANAVGVHVLEEINLNHLETGRKFAFAVAAMEQGKPETAFHGYGSAVLGELAASDHSTYGSV